MSTASEPVAADSILQAMQEFERIHPAKDRPVRIRCGPDLIGRFKYDQPFPQNPPVAIDSINGLPIDQDNSLPYPQYVIEYADGWETLVINGVKVRRKTAE